MTSERMAAVAIVVVAIVVAIIVARQFDSPTSTFLLLGITHSRGGQRAAGAGAGSRTVTQSPSVAQGVE